MTSAKSSAAHHTQTFYLDFLGCRLNAAEIEDLSRRIDGTGGKIVSDPALADVIVLNTCAVTAQASKRSLRRISKLHTLQPNADIAVLGCWATEDVKQAKILPGVKWVLPNRDKSQAVEIITGKSSNPTPWAPGKWGHTRAFLAVQDGCDHHCTYCLTKILRGSSHSRPLSEVIDVTRNLVLNGAQEVVLTGVSLGAYGDDLHIKDGLSTLVRRLLHETDVPRLRLSSIEPWDVTENLMRQWENPHLCRQLHLPLQSGSNSVLHRMGRPIIIEEFAHLVYKMRDISPEIAITTDVMVGFPGESEIEFQQTISLIENLQFSRLHVFSYSERPGTAAAKLPGGVSNKTRKARADRLRAINTNLGLSYREHMLGRVYRVLYQKRVESDMWIGLTDTYVKVCVKSSQDLYNRIIETKMIANNANHLVGQIP